MEPDIVAEESQRNAHIANYICSLCGGAERLRIGAPYRNQSFGKSVPCSCVAEQHASLQLKQQRQTANMEAFQQSTFKTFNFHVSGVQEVFHVSTEFAANPQGWLLLVGPCGCGKTHLAAAIANQHLEGGAEVFFTTVPDLLDALRAAFTAPERYTQHFVRVREVELLVLDDLGAQQPSTWSTEKLLQILNYRANNALPTIITAIPKDLPGLDERLRSRLADTQLVTTVLLKQAKDFRPQKAIADTKRRT